MDVDAGDGAHRAARPLTRHRQDHRRPVVALHQARRDDPDHPRMPAPGGDDNGAPRRPAGRLRQGHRLPQNLRLEGAPPLVLLLAPLGKRRRLLKIHGGQQRHAPPRVTEAAKGVDPRRELEGDLASGERFVGEASHLGQGPQAGPAAAVDQGQAAPYPGAVDVDERHHVADRPQRHDVQKRLEVGHDAAAKVAALHQHGAHRHRQVEGDTDAADLPEGVGGIGTLRVDHREGVGHGLYHLVVVGDDEVEPQLLGPLRRPTAVDPTVHGHHHPTTRLGKELQAVAVEAVPLLEPVREVAVTRGTAGGEQLSEQGARGDPVDVVVGKDADRLPRHHRVRQAGRRPPEVGEEERVVHLVQPRGKKRLHRRAGDPARHENPRHRQGDPAGHRQAERLVLQLRRGQLDPWRRGGGGVERSRRDHGWRLLHRPGGDSRRGAPCTRSTATAPPSAPPRSGGAPRRLANAGCATRRLSLFPAAA